MLVERLRPAFAHPIQGAQAFVRKTLAPRLVLVAPSGLFRDGFAFLIATHLTELDLERHEDVEAIGAGPARLALLAFDSSACSRESLGAKIEALRARCHGAPICLVTADDRAAGLGALGVAGVVSLSASMEDALAAVRLVSAGGFCLPPEDLPPATHPIDRDAEELAATELPVEVASASIERADPRDDLTARERDVLRSLRSGHQNKIIAYQLGISESTVKVHLRSIMKKLNASNRTQVALGGPLFFERPSAGAYGAVAPHDGVDRSLFKGARGARPAEA